MPQLFYIRTMQAPGGVAYVLNAQYGGDPYAGQNIILWQQDTGATSSNSLWALQLTPSSTAAPYPTGYIATASNPNLVIGLGPADNSGNTTIALCAKNATDPSQLWELHPGFVAKSPEYGVLVNHQTQEVMNVEWDSIQGGAQIITSVVSLGATAPADNCQWAIEPFAVPTQLPTAILSAQSTETSSLCLNVEGASLLPGTAVILWPLATTNDIENPIWQSNSIWSYTLDGYIVSAMNPNLVLSLGPNGTVVIYARQAANTAFQQWYITSRLVKQGDFNYSILQFQNVANGEYLTIQNGSAVAGAAIITAPLGASSGQDWLNNTGYPLDTILAQPAVPFPTAAAGSQAAISYDYISATVYPPVAAGIRSVYTTTNPNTLTAYLGQVEVMQQPSTVTDQAAWTGTVQQISKELAAASIVQGLYEQYYAFHTSLENSDELDVATLAGIVGASSQAKTTGEWAGFAGEMFMAALNLVPAVGGCLADMLQASVGLLSQEGGGPSSTAFTSTVGNLQSGIQSFFETMKKASALQATMVQTDWGKMSAVAALCTYPTQHPWSLNLTDDSATKAFTAASYGGEIAILQYLMPAAFQICRWWQCNSLVDENFPFYVYHSGPPSWAYYTIENSSAGVYDLYVICSGIWNSDRQVYPSQQCMDLIGSLGINPYNLYNGVGGWSNFSVVPVQVSNNWAPGEGDGSWQNILLATIWNCTSNTLTIHLTANHDGSLSTPSNLTVGPHQPITFGVNEASHMHHHATSGNVLIYDPNFSSTEEVLSFEVNGGGSCNTTWPVYNANDGYSLTPQSQFGTTYSSDNGPPDELTVWVVQN